MVRDEATARDCRVQLELGGHNPLIVTETAELDRAVEAAYAGAFWSAGQKCTATGGSWSRTRPTTRSGTSSSLASQPARSNAADPEVEVGPVVNEIAMGEILGAIERARGEGGTVLTGGERGDDEGYLIAPTVVEGLADDAELSCRRSSAR